MSIPKLDLATIHSNREKHRKYKPVEYNPISVVPQSARSNSSILSWGTHAESVINDEITRELAKARSKARPNESKSLKSNAQNNSSQAHRNSQPQNQKQTFDAKNKTSRDKNHLSHTDQCDHDPHHNTITDKVNKLDLSKADISKNSNINDLVKIKLKPTNTLSTQKLIIDQVADSHLKYLNSIKNDSQTVRTIKEQQNKMTSRGDRDKDTRKRLVRDCLDIILADQLTTSAIDNKKQVTVSSATNGFNPVARMPSRAIPKGQSRRLHDTSVNPGPEGIQTASSLEDNKIVFFCRYLSPVHLVLKNLIGTHFNHDSSTTIYEFSGFGNTRKEIRAWPVVPRGKYGFTSEIFAPGERLVVNNRKFEIDHVVDFYKNSFGLDTSTVDSSSFSKLKMAVRNELVNSNRISSIIFNLRYQPKSKAPKSKQRSNLSSNSNLALEIGVIDHLEEATGLTLEPKEFWYKIIKDTDDDSQFDSAELINSIFSPISIERIWLIKSAWMVMDSNRQAIVSRHEVEKTCNMKLIDKNWLSDFVSVIGDGENCSYDAFYYFYFGVSKLVEDEDDFAVLMRALWPI